MRLWCQITHGLRALFGRGEADRDIADEVHHYLEEAEAEMIAGGASRREARRAVRLRYGADLAAREDVRAYGWESTVEALASDLRYAARRLRRSPRFTALVVLTLGLGIGSATAIFTAVRPVLLEPLPYPDAERIVFVADRTADGSPMPVAFGSYREVVTRSGSFEALAAYKPWEPVITGGEEAERLRGQRVGAEYFRVLGVTPTRGPGWQASSDRPGGAHEVIVSDRLWRSRFGDDAPVDGAQVRLDGVPYDVVGVMPAGFENATAPLAEVWSLLQYDPTLPSFDTREWGHHLDAIGRLRAGVLRSDAERELVAIGARPVADFVRPSWAAMERGLSVRGLREAMTADVRPAMLALMGSVLLLLAIACVNVTILLLARGAGRRGELAMRVALGAGRTRLVRQLLIESLLLSLGGGAVGVLVARLGMTALVALDVAGVRAGAAPGIDGAAYVFALGLTGLIGVLVGLAPALEPSADTLRRGLGEAGRNPGGAAGPARRALVVTEVALALVLLVGAGLLLRSVRHLFAIPPGFDPDGVVAVQVHTGGLDDDATHRFYDQVLEAARTQPGVSSASLTSQLPLGGDDSDYGLVFEDDGAAEGIDGAAHRYAVSAGYAETMGIRVVRGRDLAVTDVRGAPPVVLVSESLAERAFPGRDPIGRRMHVGRTDLPWYDVVGVVGDVKQASLGDTRTNAVYLAPRQWYATDPVRWLVVRSDRDPAELVTALRGVVRAVDPNQPIVRVETMRGLLTRSEARRRFVLTVLQAFAGLALLLATLGLYGVLSGSVAERMRELGVRAALGASRESVMAIVVRQGMTLSVAGIVIGLGVAALASRALETLLFGVSGLDPLTYVGVVILLGAVSAVACWIPARRAGRADPLRALRTE